MGKSKFHSRCPSITIAFFYDDLFYYHDGHRSYGFDDHSLWQGLDLNPSRIFTYNSAVLLRTGLLTWLAEQRLVSITCKAVQPIWSFRDHSAILNNQYFCLHFSFHVLIILRCFSSPCLLPSEPFYSLLPTACVPSALSSIILRSCPHNHIILSPIYYSAPHHFPIPVGMDFLSPR